jgi:triosephosphate isomerase
VEVCVAMGFRKALFIQELSHEADYFTGSIVRHYLSGVRAEFQIIGHQQQHQSHEETYQLVADVPLLW